MSLEPAVYSLVLSHIYEVGHGWGSKPSPLRGLYVLDRIVDDVGQAFLNSSIYDGDAEGTPMSEELRSKLGRSVDPITFVPRFAGLIDLSSTESMSVKDARGLVALGPILSISPFRLVPVYFYAGPRWSRLNLYHLMDRDGEWAITHFETVVVS